MNRQLSTFTEEHIFIRHKKRNCITTAFTMRQEVRRRRRGRFGWDAGDAGRYISAQRDHFKLFFKEE